MSRDIAYGTGAGVVPTGAVDSHGGCRWLSQAATRTALLEALDSFLKQHL